MFLRFLHGAVCTCDPLLHNNSDGQPRVLLHLSTSLQQAFLWISHCAHMLEFLRIWVRVRLICISTLGPLSKEALPIYTPIGHVWRILSSSFLPLIGMTQLSSFCQSKGVKCYLVLICISLTANEFEHHFMCLLALGVSFSVNCLSYHLPIFLLELMSTSCCFTAPHIF